MALDAESVSKCSCEHCGNHIEFPVAAAGEWINCPHCGKWTQLVLAAPPPRRLTEAELAEELTQAFSGQISRPRVSLLYRLSLVLVAMGTILLPLVYLALIGLLALGLWRFGFGTAPPVVRALHFSVARLGLLRTLLYTLPAPRHRYPTGMGGLFIYLAILFLGSSLLLLLLKPLFGRRSRRSSGVAVTPELQPALFALVARLCQAVGAPMPRRIELDCRVNAGVEFRRAGAGLFGNDLVLRIGLPLVAALDLSQFAGVLAHELGHFSQGFGLRSVYVIRGVKDWFARLVYQRDSWDAWLEHQHDGTSLFSYGAGALLFAMEISRSLLRMLLLLASGLSSLLLRQMEYHADSYEIQVAGSAAFEATTRRLALLQQALDRAQREARATWNLGRHLPDNFPAFVLSKASTTLGIGTVTNVPKAGLFNAHPPDNERIRRARGAAAPGLLRPGLPATLLFSHFETLAKQATYAYYVEDLGLVLDNSNLRPVKAPLESASRGPTSSYQT